MQKESALTLVLVLCLFIFLGVAGYKFRGDDGGGTRPQKIQRLVTPPVRATDPARGALSAPVTIVVYSDFACESCAALANEITTLLDEPEFKNKIRVVWKDFPVHEKTIPQSFELHKAARCVAGAGKFWEFHNAVFAYQQEMRRGENILPRALERSGVAAGRVEPCASSSAAADAVRENISDARALGITAVPTYFINSNRTEGVMSYPMFRGIIKNALATTEHAQQ